MILKYNSNETNTDNINQEKNNNNSNNKDNNYDEAITKNNYSVHKPTKLVNLNDK